MHVSRRTLVASMALVSLSVTARLSWGQALKPTPSLTPTLTLHAALNKVTRLSVLSDRLGRGHGQRVLNVWPSRSGKIIKDSSTEAKKLLQDLANANLSSTSKAQLTKMAAGYEALLQASAAFTSTQKTDLAKFGHQADTLGTEVDQLAAQMIKDLGKPVTQVLSATADLQRLTQHLALHFMLSHAGTEQAEQQKLLTEGIDAFNTHLTTLQAAPLKNAPIDQSLQLMGNQWFLMAQALKSSEADTTTMENVCTTSERTLEVLTDLYGHYEAALKTLIG